MGYFGLFTTVKEEISCESVSEKSEVILQLGMAETKWQSHANPVMVGHKTVGVYFFYFYLNFIIICIMLVTIHCTPSF